MVGEGVLHECLLNRNVEEVLVINRKPCGIAHPKLKEIIHANFFDLSSLASQLIGYNACFYCLGVTSLGINEQQYNHVTYELTIYIAKLLCDQNPDMAFCYVSGAGTKASPNTKSMWIRVKGKTESELLKLPFRKAYMFRPGYMQPTNGLKHTQKIYLFVGWLYPVLRVVFPKFVSTLKELGLAMIEAASTDYENSILEVKDIVALAKNQV